ncbi:MAG: response regulator transcription factor [Pedobacter sp.]|nr:MAG: response regulator transcription factor [Pedobacter sp.]
MNILIADEFLIYRYVIKSYISKCWPNARIVEAGNLQEVVANVIENSFDLLILDVHMPGSQKLEEFVSRVIKGTKVIVFSEYAIETNKAKRLTDLGVEAMLLKSATSKEVVESFQAVFAEDKMKSA